MKRAEVWILIAALACCVPLGRPARADDANFLYGKKSLGEDYFDANAVDGQSELGVALTFEFDWPVALAVDILSSSDDSTEAILTEIQDYELAFSTKVDTMELDVGVRKFWEGKVKPYVGAGIAYVQLDVKQTEFGSFGPGTDFSDVLLDDNDSGLGFWLDAGLIYRLGESFNLGLDIRYSDSSADLTPVGEMDSLTLDSGGMHYGIMLGYHW